MRQLKLAFAAFAATASVSAAQAYPADFVGTWVNTNSSSRGVVRVVVDSSMNIRMYGACTPTPCDIGQSILHTFGRNVSDTNHKVGHAQWGLSFKEIEAVLSLNGTRRMSPLHLNRFTDASGRQNYWMRENFRKLPAREAALPFDAQAGEPEN